MRLYTYFSNEDLKFIPIIVECWDKKRNGRVKRAWLNTFTEKERKALSTLYKQIYNWYLVKGFPEEVRMNFTTFSLLQRAANFFYTYC